MKNMTHIAPLCNALFKNKIFLKGFAAGISLRLFNYCSQQLPELAWDMNLNFPFNPKYIPKLKDRKLRKAAYQSFARYKKSFKPVPEAILKVIRDEWKTDDLADAISYAFRGMQRKFSEVAQQISMAFRDINWDSLNDGIKKEFPKSSEYRGKVIEFQWGP